MTISLNIDRAIQMAGTTTGQERAWWCNHIDYLQALSANREIYRGLRAQAGTLGMDAEAFDTKVRAEIDEDAAGGDSGEWVRAAQEVLGAELMTSAYAECPDAEPDGWHAACWNRHIWNKACDNALLDNAVW